jgi:hypothetical protein
MDDRMKTPTGPSPYHVSGEVRLLEAKWVRLFRSREGTPRAEIDGELSCLHVRVHCAFPLSHPEEYISLRDGQGHEIGLIRSLHDLDAESRAVAEEEIERRYFLPEITAVQSLTGRFGIREWQVETDRGPRTFMVRGRSENVVQMPPHRVVVTDVLGNRYKIPDTTKLDRRSQAQLFKVL